MTDRINRRKPATWKQLRASMVGADAAAGVGKPRHLHAVPDKDAIPTAAPPPPDGDNRGGYAELHAHSNFSFLDGASSPEELVAKAMRMGLTGLAITDHDGLYSAVRFAQAARGTRLAAM